MDPAEYRLFAGGFDGEIFIMNLFSKVSSIFYPAYNFVLSLLKWSDVQDIHTTKHLWNTCRLLYVPIYVGYTTNYNTVLN